GALWSPIFVLTFFHSFFTFNKGFFYYFFLIGLLSIFFIMFMGYLLTGNLIFFQIRVFYPLMFFTLTGQIYIFFLSVKAIRMKKEMAGRMFLGVCILFTTVLSLYLGEIFLNRSDTYISDGFFGMIIVFSSTLQTRYAAVYKELQNAYSNLKLHNKLKEDFLANTSHELRSPLQAIISLAQTILRSDKIKPKIAQQLNLIYYSAKRLTYLVNDILDFSKMKENDIRLNIQNHCLNEQVDTVIALNRHQVDVTKIKLENRIQEEIFILADKERVQQILFNLIGNAVKFTKQGSVMITATTTSEKVRVKIEDTGSGISESKLKTIFDPYKTDTDVNISKLQSSGPGMAITRELIQKQKGNINIVSEEDKGTRVTFDLPKGNRPKNYRTIATINAEFSSNSSAYDKFAVSKREEVSDYSSHYVLLVDDDPVIITVLSHILKSENMEIRSAYNATSALNILNTSQKPALVILDFMMPGITGIELCEIIRDIYPPRELPILMVTAKSRFEDLAEAINSGATDFLTKPVDYDEFILRVKNLIDMSLVENEKFKLLKQQREDIYYDLHEHLGGFLTHMQDNVKALSYKEQGENRIVLELKDTIDSTIQLFRKQMVYIEDLTIISKDFLGGLQQVLSKRYSMASRSFSFKAKEKLHKKIMQKSFAPIRNGLFSIVTEIATNDLKYGRGGSTWDFREKDSALVLTVSTQTDYNPAKNRTGKGTSGIFQRVSALNGWVKIHGESNSFVIELSVPWRQNVE
ncbi:MAG: hybrid sensor histidine kinase/response regulator, partial [Leptospirales bacterium]